MNKYRYVIILPESSPAQQTTLNTFFQKGGYGFWHWSPETWCVTTLIEPSAIAMRDKVNTIVPGARVLVLQADDPALWAMTGLPRWAEWFKEHWAQ